MASGDCKLGGYCSHPNGEAHRLATMAQPRFCGRRLWDERGTVSLRKHVKIRCTFQVSTREAGTSVAGASSPRPFRQVKLHQTVDENGLRRRQTFFLVWLPGKDLHWVIAPFLEARSGGVVQLKLGIMLR